MDKEYIERGYLIKEAENILIYRMQSCMSHERIEDAVSTLEWLKYNAPAADVMGVRYGRVIVHEGHEDEYYEYCSECKTKNIHSEDNFCPNCGCKFVGVKHSNSKE